MDIKRKDFIRRYTDAARVRQSYLIYHRKVLEFVIQLEICINEKWFAVVRYDTAHGYAHRDYLHPDGRIDKTPIFYSNYNEALTFVEEDIKNNWQLYQEHFIKEVAQNDGR
ncbi:MAG: hypothetical protein KKC11_05345 [Candidatus Omnitrophica bacterium]|nr:hypothetical protein [Candidatus Omnitrophota bacterium]MBU1133383.1 hypothetical protein [Candidatus Omnitrophota bacterium]MBU1810212.1 hypothetical protein [Candidatus Omnitrophota bacterium]